MENNVSFTVGPADDDRFSEYWEAVGDTEAYEREQWAYECQQEA